MKKTPKKSAKVALSGKKTERVLEISVSRVPWQKLSAKRQKRWQPILKAFGYGFYDPFIVFLAEALAILSKTAVEFSGTYDNKGFGTIEELWSLKSGNTEIFRAYRSELCESMQRVEVEDNRTVISGFSPVRGLAWNGDCDEVFGMKLRLWGISDEEEKQLQKIAHELFNEVEIHEIR